METVIDRMIPHIAAWWPHLYTFSYVFGGIFVVLSGFQMVNPENKFTKKKAIASFFAGVLLLNFPSLMDSLAYTIFNSGSEQALSYSPPSHPGSVYVKFAVYATMTIGCIGITRACMLLRDSASQSPQLYRAITHFIGGILAVNIVQFIQLLGSSAGGDVQSTVNAIIG